MRKFARVMNGEVVEIIDEKSDIAREWHADFLTTCVEITNAEPKPDVGWIRSPQGVFSPAPEYILTPIQIMNAAIREGFTVYSTAYPTINGVYEAAGSAWGHMKDEMFHISVFDGFSGDAKELVWRTRDGEIVFSDPSHFKSVVKGISDRLAAWRQCVDGKTAPPSGPVEIA